MKDGSGLAFGVLAVVGLGGHCLVGVVVACCLLVGGLEVVGACALACVAVNGGLGVVVAACRFSNLFIRSCGAMGDNGLYSRK